MYVIGLNGPPRSGKDTVGEMIADVTDLHGSTIPVFRMNLAAPMRAAMMALIGLDPSNQQVYEASKDVQLDYFDNMTLRGLMIDFSESYMKPKFGSNIWSRLVAAAFHSRSPGILVLQDVGFQLEADFWQDWATSGMFVTVQIHRPGCDFSNDSREWVTSSQEYKLVNDSDLDNLKVETHKLIQTLQSDLGWSFN